ncbi:MAG: hypothetical protein JJU37_00795 [Balneolaceae bacterium]|nr:hypothetical protein [Balneolaceae bacterium]
MNEGDSNIPEKNKDSKHLQKREIVEEYRLISIDDYAHKDDEKIIDLVGILKDLWLQKRVILGITGVIFLLGIIFYLGSERIYYSEAKLMPESTSPSSQLGQVFQQAENIFGLQRRVEDDDIRVAMYPYIVESLPFQLELMQHEVYFGDLDRRVTIFEYFTEHYEPSLIDRSADFLWSYTIGLPVTIWRAATTRRPEPGDENVVAGIDFSLFSDFNEPKVLDNQIRRVANQMSNYITISREPQTGFVSIGVSLPDAQASTEIVILVKNLLQEYVIDYRTEKALKNLEFIELQYEDAKLNFQAKQDSLAAFQDRNVNPARQTLLVREQRLQSEYDLAFSLYNTLARRLQEAKIQVQEETPVFRVHEPATIPSRPAQPNAIRIMGGSIFIGLFLGISFIYIRRGLRQFLDEFHRKEPKTYQV